jgi:hypothetical protein
LEICVSIPTGPLASPMSGGAPLSRLGGNENEVAKRRCIRSRWALRRSRLDFVMRAADHQ